ncbi:hypothetical protein [Mahella sp.]|uniref:hypothetical protein n=1 Tax=Mahella sp. TaxID=2798721 RepID=UPI0025BF4406|nr:hypothetical protein [Mahella sp.]MBZ4665067.1 hypothetical protein [Mahella sp.]
MKDFDQLLTSLYQEGKYIFEDLPWLISKEEVMERKQLNDNNSVREDLLKIDGIFPFNDSSLEQTVLFVFEDDKFVSGEYLFSTADHDEFIKFCEELKTHLEKSLPKPFGNDLSVFDNAKNVDTDGQGESVSWKGEDGSYLMVDLLAAAQEDDKKQYIIQIQSTSPLPEKEGLQ